MQRAKSAAKATLLGLPLSGTMVSKERRQAAAAHTNSLNCGQLIAVLLEQVRQLPEQLATLW
jgi:hypothetical protein